MNASVFFDLHPGPCEAHHKYPHCIAQFEISTFSPGEGQSLWSEAFCCPTCGQIWAREGYLADAKIRWSFTPRECGSHIVSAEFFDYLLISENLSSPQMEFLIHEYGRCFEYYRAHTSHLTRHHDI